MPLDPKPQFTEAERAELERVVEALARWPRLSHLLQFMQEKLFSDQLDQINEYNIATEVLGRSKTVFNASEDAIARVEAHRLRKHLLAFYETEGKDHPIQITLPPGSYVPVFVHKPEPMPSAPSIEPTLEAPATNAASGLTPQHSGERSSLWLIRHWRYSVAGAFLVLASLGAYLHFHAAASRARSTLGSRPSQAEVSEPNPSKELSAPIRLLAGYSGPPRADSAGTVWNSDRYFSGGGAWQRSSAPIARTRDPFIFEHSRTGDFSYAIPLRPGSYELHLFFCAPNENVSTFNVSINGESVLLAFDINVDSMGDGVADERVFRDISPGQDGFLRLQFSAVTSPTLLSAIEILASAPHTQLPIRLIMQSTPITDSKGRFWRPDDYYMNGQLANPSSRLADSFDPDLFAGERYGHFTYALPVDSRDKYTLVLHFAEMYFTGSPGNGGAGSRVFKVICNGQTLLDNFDIFKEAGSLHEVSKTFRHLKPSAQGKLNLTFEPIANNATVSGIEVLDEAQ
jgi:hypothetical protein